MLNNSCIIKYIFLLTVPYVIKCHCWIRCVLVGPAAHCYVYVARENKQIWLVKWQFPLIIYSKTVICMTMGIADDLTRYKKQFPYPSNKELNISVDGDCQKLTR